MSQTVLSFWAAIWAVFATFVPNSAQGQGQSLPPDLLPVCTGWVPSKQAFALVGINAADTAEDFCPAGSAYFSVVYPGNQRRPGAKVNVVGTCCPLPAHALLDDTVFVPEECPDGFVATGTRQNIGRANPGAAASAEFSWADERVQELRCTKLDTERFVLTEPTGGRNIGWRRSFRTYFDSYVLRTSIPVSLRFGLGRFSQYSWNEDSCIGLPWGAVLVAKKSKYCDGMMFRSIKPREHSAAWTSTEELQTAARQLDYQSCLRIEPMYGAQARCVQAKSAETLKLENSQK